MRRLVAIAGAIALSMSTQVVSQVIPPPALQSPPILDEAMVIVFQDIRLELLSDSRAIPVRSTDGRTTRYRIVATSGADSIGPEQLGVARNHSLKKLGFLTGEIAFKLKGDLHPTGFSEANYPQLSKVINPNVYAVRPATPTEYVTVFKRLSNRGDIDWVEPVVIYGATTD
jgi:hypothetical protein